MISTTRMICVCTKHGGDCSRTFVCGGGLFQVYPSPVGDKMPPTGVTRVLRNFTHLHSIHRRGMEKTRACAHNESIMCLSSDSFGVC